MRMCACACAAEMRRGRRAHATKAFRRGVCGTRKTARKPRNMGMRGGSILSGENKYPSPYTLPARPQLSKNPAEMVVVAGDGWRDARRNTGGGGINSRFRIARNREAYVSMLADMPTSKTSRRRGSNLNNRKLACFSLFFMGKRATM